MLEEIVIAGFGGQGILSAGVIVAHASMDEGLNAAWIPSYGPEMRGGTANCTVIASDEQIGSPVTSHPTGVIVMNAPSFERFEPLVRPGGVLVVNSSLIELKSRRTDIRVIPIPTNEIAAALGSALVGSIVAVGALLGARPFVQRTSVETAFASVLPAHRQHLVPLNMKALERGMEAAGATAGVTV